ncbi:hypothetical protein [Aliidiomarina sp.]|uniref:hypothetical protein n=1 Tax=Aliidiomarina sp. TaxID=1872439 RepID=UPI003A4D3BAD
MQQKQPQQQSSTSSEQANSEQTKLDLPMPAQQRAMWIGLSILLLTIPVWFDAVAMPGDYLFIWRWTETQVIFESLITTGFLVAAIAGYFTLRRGVGDWQHWKIARLGVGIWIAMIALLTLFSLVMYYAGNQQAIDTYEGEGYTISALGSGSADNSQIFVVMSCDYRGVYKRVIHLDRFVGADNVEFRRDGQTLFGHYTLEGRELRYQEYDLEALYQQCLTGDSPRPF